MVTRITSLFLLVSISLLVSYCMNKSEEKTGATASEANALLQKWEGPYNGVPPFDKVEVSLFLPAFEAAMTENRNEIAEIASNKAAPTFANTIEALEKAGTTLKRVQAIYEVWKNNRSTPELEAIQTTMEPRLAAFADSITQNAALFARIEAVNNDPAKKNLTPEQQRLLWRYHTNFVLKGAKLDPASKEKVAAINQQLAGLFAKFSQNQLADESDKYLELTSEKDLDGLPEDLRAAAAEAAAGKNKSGTWIIANTRSSIEPFLTYANRRDLREKAWRMFINRGDNGDANDNNALVTQILQLRAERAKLLGYPTHAHWRLADKMAQTPEKAMQLLEAVWTPAVGRVKEEVKDMQQLADKAGDKIKIEPWDYRYYAEKVRKARYDLDQDEVKQYLQLEKLREGMFFVAGELFNFAFEQVTDVPVFHPDVRVYKVTDKTSGQQVGMWYFDPYAREGKRSGAWMTAYREQETLNGNITTIVSNNCNFIKGKPGEPVLISWEDAETLFHEFGHALHGLNSKVTYPLLSGTNTATDYVEFPSQILERWLSTPEVLQKYALHYKTGQPIPQALVDKINNASKFNQGFATVELIASALIDMKLHLAGSAKIDPDAFEKENLAALGMPSEIVMRHRTPQFGHIFADDGYSAGYYSYLWSDVLSADAYEAFTEAG
ncbi:MAG: M3 family metallopeptidase, partial [Saprospiraceae bacterium]|nr:M3 family metallopeptidase [Saprospiraceae bacterium]